MAYGDPPLSYETKPGIPFAAPGAALVAGPSESQPHAARCAVSQGSDLGCIASRFVIYQEPGKIPMKKGPFGNDDQVEKMLIEMRPHYHSDTIYTVAEVTHDHDIWLTIASEFLTFREVWRMPDDEDQNGTGEPTAAAAHKNPNSSK